jgi:hypothetical protein
VANDSSVMNKVRRAAHDLERAIVEIGPDPLQLHTFFDRVEQGPNGRSLLLSPIAATALPRTEYGPVRIHCESAEGPWTIVCPSIVPVSDDCARVALVDARIAAPDYMPRAAFARRQLALVTPVGIRGSDANVFPLVELDAATCVIDAATAFELGQYLPIVELVGDRHVLRRCAATVFQIVPWCTPEGSRRFRCLLRLSESEPAVEDGLLETVSDPARVRRTLEFAAMSNTLGWYEIIAGPHSSTRRGEARFLEAGRDALVLSLFPTRDTRTSPRHIKIGFSLFAVEYEMTVRVLTEDQHEISTAFPLNVRRGRSFRQDHAPAELTQDLRLHFRNPVSGDQAVYPVTRLSVHKLVCQVDSRAELLWEGLPLDDVRLSGTGSDIPIGSARVTTVTTHGQIRHVELAIQHSNQQNELTSLVSSELHSEVTIHDGQNFRNMLAIYKEAGLFAPHMRDNLDVVAPQVKRVWHAMHQEGAELVQTFVHGPPDQPDGAASIIRAWERGWLAQHMVSVSQQFNGAAGHLQLAVLDYVQRRPDGQYLIYFVKTDNRQMNSFHERFLATSGTPESIDRRTLQFWQRSGSAKSVTLDTGRCLVQPLRRAQEALISRAAERELGMNGAAALSFLPGEFQLPDTATRFGKLGIVRKRHCAVVGSTRGVPLWAVAEEISSQGVNFTWMLNASWLFPVHGALDDDRTGLSAALQYIVERPAQTPTGDVFVNTVGAVDEALMHAAGFEKLADVYLYALNRAGLNRCYYYTSDRYGEVDARTYQRQARRSGVRLRSGESLTSIAPAKIRTG